MAEPHDLIVVQTTVDQEGTARRIAEKLVEKRLAACVQILGPMTSVYRWRGNLETATEWLCLVKAPRDNYAGIEQAIRSEHPYELPEIVAIPVVAGSTDYLAWVGSSTAAP